MTDNDDFIQTLVKVRLVRPLAITNASIPRKNIKIFKNIYTCIKIKYTKKIKIYSSYK